MSERDRCPCGHLLRHHYVTLAGEPGEVVQGGARKITITCDVPEPCDCELEYERDEAIRRPRRSRRAGDDQYDRQGDEEG
jgi:hypothetical protein